MKEIEGTVGMMIPVSSGMAFPSIQRAPIVAILALAVIVSFAPAAMAACGNGVVEPPEQCDDGSTQNGGTNSCCTTLCFFSTKAPDVIVGDITTPTRWGTLNGITAYSIGTSSCNIGSCWLNWFSSIPEHPVIGQAMYRLKSGRFEQVGQSWLKHGFTALTQSLCGTCIPPGGGSHLGVNCSDPYDGNLNGSQSRLGPKGGTATIPDINPVTGVYTYPDSRITDTTGVTMLSKRLQVHNADLDPALNAGAAYFVEGQYVTHDDATAKNNANNASYRAVTVGASPNFNLALTGTTQRQKAAIQAWKVSDPTVTEVAAVVPSDGIIFVSAKATSLGGGLYHYEYAVQNLTSHRAAQSFSVPIPAGATVTNVGFHDVDYHSGEPFGGTDWTPTVGVTSVSWMTQAFSVNANANALRWGTLYNFRFDANIVPGTAAVGIGVFKPGSPTSISVSSVAPGSCFTSESICGNAADDDCDNLTDCADPDCCASAACSASDADGDHFAAVCDCNDANAAVYPGAPQLCDGINNNCSAPGWPAVPANESDADGDSFRVCAGDCNDANAAIHPGAPDAICNGIDENCSGTPDEGYIPEATACGQYDCARTGATSCVGGAVHDSCISGIPAPDDSTCDGVDEDCDGSMNEDYAPVPTACGVGGCARSGVTSCVSKTVVDSCVPGAPGPDDPTCDGIDDDCDATVDEEYVPIATNCGVGPCARTGTTSCAGGTVQDSCVPGEPSPEVCDSIDNNCDGVVDNPQQPSGRPLLLLSKPAQGSGTALLGWGSVLQATGYDVVRGNLSELQASSGDFSLATHACIAQDVTSTTLTDEVVETFWYLVRAINCGGDGTYDSNGPAQAGSRDTGIRQSGLGCP